MVAQPPTQPDKARAMTPTIRWSTTDPQLPQCFECATINPPVAAWCVHVMDAIKKFQDVVTVPGNDNRLKMVAVPLCSPVLGRKKPPLAMASIITTPDGPSDLYRVALSEYGNFVLGYFNKEELHRMNLALAARPIVASWTLDNPCRCGPRAVPTNAEGWMLLAAWSAYRRVEMRAKKADPLNFCSQCNVSDLVPDIDPSHYRPPRTP